MINQNNSKGFQVVNQSQTNKKVQMFIHQDLKKLRLKKKNLNELFQKIEDVSQITLSRNIFQENIDDDNENTIKLISQTYQLKQQEREQNSSKNNSKSLQNVFRKQKSEKSFRELKNVNRLTNIAKINLTQKDDSLLSDYNKKQKETSQTQCNINSIRFLQQNSKTQQKVELTKKKIEDQKNYTEELEQLPQIWQQYYSQLYNLYKVFIIKIENKVFTNCLYNIQPEKVKIQAKNSFLKLNDQLKQMEIDKVLEPFLKNQKLKVKLMTPLTIRKDKPYFVAENKDNKNLI